jgi:hypothetical protein
MTILICDCDSNRACTYHAEELYDRDQNGENEHTMNILDSMIEDARNGDTAMAGALLALYGDDIFTPADLDAIRKVDAKGWNDSADCACNTCADAGKWFNQ